MAPELRLSLQQPDGRHRAVLARHRVARWIRATLQTPAQLTVRIVDEDEGRALNRDYRGRDYATNVLSFPYEQGGHLAGDLVVCQPVLVDEAQAQGKPFADHAAHLIVHGMLHLQGWDHETSDADADDMEAEERIILATLGVADPYAGEAGSHPAGD